MVVVIDNGIVEFYIVSFKSGFGDFDLVGVIFYKNSSFVVLGMFGFVVGLNVFVICFFVGGVWFNILIFLFFVVMLG